MLSHELLSTKIYYTSIYIFYVLFWISRQVQKSQNHQNPTSTAEVIHRTSINFWNNLLLSFEFKATREE